MASRIAFVGLGNMGGPMAANLLRQGYQVSGFDIMPEALENCSSRRHASHFGRAGRA